MANPVKPIKKLVELGEEGFSWWDAPSPPATRTKGIVEQDQKIMEDSNALAKKYQNAIEARGTEGHWFDPEGNPTVTYNELWDISNRYHNAENPQDFAMRFYGLDPQLSDADPYGLSEMLEQDFKEYKQVLNNQGYAASSKRIMEEEAERIKQEPFEGKRTTPVRVYEPGLTNSVYSLQTPDGELKYFTGKYGKVDPLVKEKGVFDRTLLFEDTPRRATSQLSMSESDVVFNDYMVNIVDMDKAGLKPKYMELHNFLKREEDLRPHSMVEDIDLLNNSEIINAYAKGGSIRSYNGDRSYMMHQLQDNYQNEYDRAILHYNAKRNEINTLQKTLEDVEALFNSDLTGSEFDEVLMRHSRLANSIRQKEQEIESYKRIADFMGDVFTPDMKKTQKLGRKRVFRGQVINAMNHQHNKFQWPTGETIIETAEGKSETLAKKYYDGEYVEFALDFLNDSGVLPKMDGRQYKAYKGEILDTLKEGKSLPNNSPIKIETNGVGLTHYTINLNSLYTAQRKSGLPLSSWLAGTVGAGATIGGTDEARAEGVQEDARKERIKRSIENQRKPKFVDRIENPWDYGYLTNNDGSISTHQMAAEIDGEGNAYAFPMIVQTKDGLHRFEDPMQALEWNKTQGNVLPFDSIKEALEYSKNYKTPEFEFHYRGRQKPYQHPEYIGGGGQSMNPMDWSRGGGAQVERGLRQIPGTYPEVLELLADYSMPGQISQMMGNRAPSEAAVISGAVDEAMGVNEIEAPNTPWQHTVNIGSEVAGDIAGWSTANKLRKLGQKAGGYLNEFREAQEQWRKQLAKGREFPENMPTNEERRDLIKKGGAGIAALSIPIVAVKQVAKQGDEVAKAAKGYTKPKILDYSTWHAVKGDLSSYPAAAADPEQLARMKELQSLLRRDKAPVDLRHWDLNRTSNTYESYIRSFKGDVKVPKVLEEKDIDELLDLDIVMHELDYVSPEATDLKKYFYADKPKNMTNAEWEDAIRYQVNKVTYEDHMIVKESLLKDGEYKKIIPGKSNAQIMNEAMDEFVINNPLLNPKNTNLTNDIFKEMVREGNEPMRLKDIDEYIMRHLISD